MTLTLIDIKARIKAVMDGIAGMGNVYVKQRNLSAEKDMDKLVKDGRLHVWMMRRDAVQLSELVVNQNFVEQNDTLVMDGYFAVNDDNDSDETFDALIDSILQIVNADRRAPSKLNGTVKTARPPQMRKKDLVMFCNTLCHHAEISIQYVPNYLQ